MEKRTGRREIWAARFALSRIYHPSHPANGWPFSSPDSGHGLSLSFSASLKSIFASFPSAWSSRATAAAILSLSLVFFSSPLSSNSSFLFDEHEAEERKNERCCRNGIGLINVGGPQIWLNSEQRWTSSRIKFLPEAYTTLSRTRSPFSRLFGSVGIRDDFSEGRLSSLNRLNEVFSLSLSLSPFWRIKRSKLDGVDRNIGTRGAELLDDFFGGSWRVFFFFRCALFVFRGFAIHGLDIPRDTFYVCFMHGRRKFFHVIFHGFRGNRGECNTLCVLWM